MADDARGDGLCAHAEQMRTCDWCSAVLGMSELTWMRAKAVSVVFDAVVAGRTLSPDMCRCFGMWDDELRAVYADMRVALDELIVPH